MEYAKGEHSYAICMRSGKKTLQRDMCIEPGTGLWVAKDESDGQFSSVLHPQNKPPKNRLEMKPQRFALSGKREAVINFLLTEDGDYILDMDGQPIVAEDWG